MNECTLSKNGINKIQSGFMGIRMRMRQLNLSTTEIRGLIDSLINSYRGYKDPSVSISTDEELHAFDESVIAAISVAAKRFGFMGDPRFIQDERDLKTRFYRQLEDPQRLPTGNLTTDQLRTVKEVPYEKDSKGEFLIGSYGRAKRVREKAEKKMSVDFVNSILIDRSDDAEGPRVINNDEVLNQKIRRFKLKLLDTILNSLDRFYKEAKGAGDPVAKYRGLQMFSKGADGHWVYTGAIETLEKDPVLDMFNPENLGENGPDVLNALDSDLDRKYLLDGYNAYQFLKHFDEYFYMKYGKIVAFDSFGKRTGENVYHFIQKGTNNSTTWRDSDDIDILKECPLAVQEIINTTRLYEFGSAHQLVINGDPAYLHFSDLSLVIGKIKDLVFNMSDIDLNGEDEDGISLLELLQVSNETKRTAKGLTLFLLINRIRINPLKYLGAIFEILGTPEAFNALVQENANLQSQFSKEDKDIIYSLQKEVFANSGNSINALSREDPVNNYYSWITQTCDSISKINFLLYYRDSSGTIRVRNMSDTRLDVVNRNVRQLIRTINSKKANGDFTRFLLENFTGNFLKFEKTDSGITFIKLFGSLYVKVDVKNDGTVVTTLMATTNGGKDLTPSNIQSLDAQNPPEGILEFISSIVGLRITPEFLKAASLLSNTQQNDILKSLWDLTSRTLFLRYISQEVLKGKNSDIEIKKALQLTIGTQLKYDKTLGELDTIHAKDTNTLEIIAKTLAYQQGLFSSNQIKSGNGNSQSQYALSRLLGALATQMDLLCRNPEATMVDSFLITNPEVFKGIYTAREFYSGDLDKDHTNFTAQEFLQSQICYDFLGGLAPVDKTKSGLVGNGTIALLPSVNSDKNTIGRMLIDTNMKVTVPELFENVAIKDLTEEQFEAFISYDLGKAYEKAYNHIIDDFRTLLNWTGYKDTTGNPINYSKLFNKDMYLNGFSAINTAVNQIYKGKKTPIQFINELCSLYNQAHRNNPIHLTDLIHFLGKKNLESNQTLLSYLFRFEAGPFSLAADPSGIKRNSFSYYDLMGGVGNAKGFVTSREFWQIKEAEIFKSLLNAGFQLDTLDESRPEIAYLRDYKKGYYKSYAEYTKWVDVQKNIQDTEKHTGLLILGYLDGKKILSKDDLEGMDLTDPKILVRHNLELNPIFKKYNYMDYLFTLEFMLSTVGSCIAHPSKYKPSISTAFNAYDILGIHSDTDSFINAGSKIATKFIGEYEGLEGSPNADYAAQAGERANVGEYFPNDVVMVSMPGKYGDIKTRLSVSARTIGEAMNALDTGVKLITHTKKEMQASGVTLPESKTFDEIENAGADYALLLDLLLSGATYTEATIDGKKVGVWQLFIYSLEEEAGRFLAQHKRNVSYTAAMQEFLLGLLNGIPSKYNIAILDDIRDHQYNVSGDIDEIKPFDGATFVNPFVTYLENNSLNGAKAGISKKQFVHYYDERTGTGGIIKTAGFGLTNDWIRNSKLLLRMMYKMTKGTWLNENGSACFTDITKNYKGENIAYGDIYYKRDGKYYKVPANGILAIYIDENGVENTEGKGTATNRYNITEQELEVVRIPGQLGVQSFRVKAIKPSVRTVTINSNYTLWNAFGGMNALEVNGTSLVPSENSITKVVDAMNQIGTTRNGVQAENVRTLDDLYLPLKNSDIHYCPTIGAVKQGAANINSASTYYDDVDYSFMKINLNQIGIQLDKEHHADGEELSLMTLVISACAHKGYTGEVANKIYNALKTLTGIGTHDILEPVMQFFQISKNEEATNEEKKAAFDDIKEAVVNTVIAQMSRETLDESSLLYTLAGELLKKARDGQHLKLRDDILGNLPIDNPQIYRLFLSKLSVFLTNSGIKAKIPGLLSVLTPSHLLMKIHSSYYLDEDGNLLESALKPEAIQNQIDDQGNEIAEEDYLETLQLATPKVVSEDGTIHYHNLKQNRDYLVHYTLPQFQLGTFKDGRFAESNPTTKVITYRETPVSVDEFFEYITGNLPGVTSQQKAVVFEQLEKEGYTRLYLQKLIQTPEDVQKLILWHELAHMDRPPKDYWDYEKEHGIDTKAHPEQINWLDGRKLAEEFRATVVGIKKLEYEKGFKKFKLRTPKDRHLLRNLILKGRISFCQEYIKDGRDLGEYDAQFFGTNGQEYSLYDLDSIRSLFELKDCLDGKGVDLQTFLTKWQRVIPQGDYTSFKELEKPLRKTVRHDTAMLSKQGGKFYKDYDSASVYIDGLLVQIDRTKALNIIPYEIVAPKANASKFGLRKYDSIDDIKKNPDFFFERLMENFGTKMTHESSFDIELKCSDNDVNSDDPRRSHIYLLDRANLTGSSRAGRPHIAENLLKIEPLTEIIDGKRYFVDADRNPIYELRIGDEIYQEIDSGTYVIVSDNLLYYLENLKYVLPRISDYYYVNNPGLFGHYEDIIKRAGTKNRAALKWANFIFSSTVQKGPDGQFLKDADEHLIFVDNLLAKQEANALLYGDLVGNYLDNPNAPLFKYLHTLGREILSSFMLSLECVASRTPSQSMQSFMPMRIVAFDNPDINTAYVSTAQIWLQGSDYDIDAVSIAMYDIGKDGKLVTWSPMSDLSSLKNLRDSLELPFPTGEAIEATATDDDAKSFKDNLELFNTYAALTNDELFLVLFTEKGARLIQNTGKVEQAKAFIEQINANGITELTDRAAQEIADRLGITKEQVQQFQLAIIDKINEHNLYLNNTSAAESASAANNYSLYNIYLTTLDPLNLIQSLSSVDAMTGPIKKIGNTSASAGDVKTRTPGNFANKVESILENLVGKMGISICAVGMKTFFGLTGYANNVLNNPNATPEEKQRILINGGKGITINGELYTHLADINPDLTAQLQEEWLLKLAEALTEDDAALVLSAMLSLATDNAKELLLSKLNAGLKTIGMYLYGIMIGVPATDIAGLLMSPIGKTITDLMDSNVFTGQRGCSTLNDVFNYLEVGPKELLANYNLRSFIHSKNGLVPLESPSEKLGKLLKLLFPNDSGSASLTLAHFAWASSIKTTDGLGNENIISSLDEKLAYIDSLTYGGTAGLAYLEDINNLAKAKHYFELLKMAAKKYIKLVYQIALVDENGSILGLSELYLDIKKLAGGAEEAKVLGLLLGLNKGLKSKTDEQIKKVKDIETSITARARLVSDEIYREQMRKFYASNDPKKKRPKKKTKKADFKLELLQINPDEVVKNYEQVRHSFNIFDCVLNVPHFKGYLLTLIVDHIASMATSPKYNFIYDLGSTLAEKYGVYGRDSEQAYKNLELYYTDLVRRTWMKEKHLSIMLDKGLLIFVKGLLKTTTGRTEIVLGTPDADATFKHWVELILIPELKKKYPYNRFILDLLPQIVTRTISHSPVINYGLPINMMPHTDSEQAAFDSYKSEFNKLRSYTLNSDSLGVFLSIMGPDGEFTSVAEALYLYGLIAHYGKSGQLSLMPIFLDILDNGLAKDFHAFEDSFSGIDPDSINQEEIRPYVIPTKSLWDATSTYVYALNKDTMRTELYRKTQEDPGGYESDEYDTGAVKKNLVINGYELVRQGKLVEDEATNHYMYGDLGLAKDSTDYNLSFDYDEADLGSSKGSVQHHVEVHYDPITGVNIEIEDAELDDKYFAGIDKSNYSNIRVSLHGDTIEIKAWQLLPGASFSTEVTLATIPVKGVTFDDLVLESWDGQVIPNKEYYSLLVNEVVNDLRNGCI